MLCEEESSCIKTSSHPNVSEWNTICGEWFEGHAVSPDLQSWETLNPRTVQRSERLWHCFYGTALPHRAVSRHGQALRVHRTCNKDLCGCWSRQCTLSCEGPRKSFLSRPSDTTMLLQSTWLALILWTLSLIPFSFPLQKISESWGQFLDLYFIGTKNLVTCILYINLISYILALNTYFVY